MGKNPTDRGKPGTKKHIPVVEYAFNDPNALYNTSDDNWEYIARMSGAYVFPHGITLLGRLFDEGTVARAGLVLERAFGVAGERPPGF